MFWNSKFCLSLFCFFRICPRISEESVGLKQLNDLKTSKGLAYTDYERDKLKIRGLLPPRVLTPEEQVEWCVKNVERLEDELDKFVFLRDLQDSNEHMFYRCLMEKGDMMLPIVYTPTVGDACKNYGLIYRRPRGMFISLKDKGKIEKVLRNWPIKDVKAIVVTDGERILGLGDLGANGMGIPVGKMALYTALGGVHPNHCLPITLDVGTNNEEFLKPDSMYIGLKQRRAPDNDDKGYLQFVDEFMKAVVKVFGRNTLIQFEDFASRHAYMLLERYRKSYTTFNDDIQGSASVAVAGLLTAERFLQSKLSDFKVLVVGSGSASQGVANLIINAMGGDHEEAAKKIYIKGSKKLITKEDEETLKDWRRNFCHEVAEGNNVNDLAEIIKWLKPNILIGLTGRGKVFTKEVLEAMADASERPIIMPLSNPNSQSECTAEEAYTFTRGKCLFASGSPFPPVMVDGSLRKPNQCNNAYVFPGVALAVTVAQMSTIPDEVFLIAAKTLANECMEQTFFDEGSLYPPVANVRDCSVKIASNVVKYAFDNKLARLKPRPADIEGFIRKQEYKPDYDPVK